MLLSRVAFTYYYRFDSQDGTKQHGDIREFAYIHCTDDWEVRIDIRKEFWSVTEFQHLVDVFYYHFLVGNFCLIQGIFHANS